MRRMFWQNNTMPIGVDIGNWGIKLVQIKLENGIWKVTANSRQAYTDNIFCDSARRKNIIADTLRSALNSSNFHGAECVCSMCPSDVKLRAVRLPRMSDQELTKAVVWEAADRFELNHGTFEVDWIRAGEVVQGDETRDEIILLAATHEDIEVHLDALIECRLRPVALDTSFTSLARLFTRNLRREKDRGTAQIVIDVGEGGTSIIMTRGTEIAFIKYLNIGSRSFVDAIKQALNLDDESAQQLRSQYVINYYAESDDNSSKDTSVIRAIFDAQRPVMHKLAEEAALCLRYYGVTFRGGRPNKVILTGGAGNEPYLATILNKHLNVDTEVAKHIKGCDIALPSCSNREDDRSDLYNWAVALGSCMRGYAKIPYTEKNQNVKQLYIENNTEQEAA